LKVKVRETEQSSFKPGFVRLSAEVEYDDDYPSEVLWFDVEESYKDGLSKSGNPWVVSLLPLAVYLGQDIYIDRACDYQLLQNLEEIMAVWNSWDKALSRISIVADTILEPAYKKDRRAAFFSGGVDSFFTILKLEEQAKNNKARSLNDLILVWGFDVPLQNSEEFLALSNTLKIAADKLNKNLIPIITNLKLIRFNQAAWGEHSHGAALASIAFVLENHLDAVYLGSGHSYYDLVAPWGSHPLVDNLFSGSATKTHLHGSPFKRVDKTEFLASSEIALSALHVCWQDASHKNCGHCNKCYRTMITLFIMNTLENCPTFEQNFLQLDDIARLYSNDESSISLIEEIAEFAYIKNKPEIAEAVLKSVRMSRRINRILPTLNQLCKQWPFRRVACFVRRQLLQGVIC
jgi:hypothetical protein